MEKLKLTDVNSFLACQLCQGYLIDAVTLSECGHSYCRSCLLGYNRYDTRCPHCHRGIGKAAVRLDHDLQRIVYKMVPDLFNAELKRRVKFYEKTNASSKKKKKGSERRRSSSSRKSAPKRDKLERIFDRHLFRMASVICSHESTICVSLEYVRCDNIFPQISSPKEEKDVNDEPSTSSLLTQSDIPPKKRKQNMDNNAKVEIKSEVAENTGAPFKRYFRCPAGITVGHLIKILHTKFTVDGGHAIGVVCGNKPLLDDETLLDVALMFNWHRTKPLRLKFAVIPLRQVKTAPIAVPEEDDCLEAMPSLMREMDPIQSPGEAALPREPTPDPLKNFEEACLKATPTVRFDKNGTSVVTTSHSEKASTKATSKRSKSPKERAASRQNAAAMSSSNTPTTIPPLPPPRPVTPVISPSTAPTAFPQPLPSPVTVPVQPPTNFSDITTFIQSSVAPPPTSSIAASAPFVEQPRRKKRKASSPSKKTKPQSECSREYCASPAAKSVFELMSATMPPNFEPFKPTPLDSPKLTIDEGCSDSKPEETAVSSTHNSSTDSPQLPFLIKHESAAACETPPTSSFLPSSTAPPPLLLGNGTGGRSTVAFSSTPPSPSLSIALPLVARTMPVPPPPRKMALPPKPIIPSSPQPNTLSSNGSGNGGAAGLPPIFPNAFNGGGMFAILIDSRRFPQPPSLPPQSPSVQLPTTTASTIRPLSHS